VTISRPVRLPLLLALTVLGLAPSSPAQSSGGWSGGSSRHLAIDFLDVGQGDSILIRSPEGKTALIDAGPSRDAATRQLHSKGISSIDIAIVTHHHSDHYGGMDQVIRTFKPKYFMATGSSHSTRGYLRLLETVKAEEITFVEPTRKPRKIELGSVLLTVLPQPPEDHAEENNNSIGVHLKFGEFSALLTGDSQQDERAWWEAQVPEMLRDCAVLKLAHHGSRNGTDQRWLDLVQPEIAIASLGSDNEYGHPHSETISLLRRNQIPMLRTDLRGTITIVSDGKTWNLVSPGLARRRGSRSNDAVAATTTDEESGSSRSSSSRTRRR
jgi:beta-lactamase superfamily II metal-dependent hydrolase